MKTFVALVTSFVVFTLISQSHTVESTVTHANQNDDVVPRLNPGINLDAPDSNKTTKSPSSNEDELVFAHVIYRHGQRDILNHIELTKEGKMHLYRLGQYFHRRYGKLIADGYQPDKIYVLSTDHDRAIMSAQVNLAGMFEPNETEKWHQNITWQPIPVHTLPMQLDNILRPINKGHCPRYDIMYDWYIRKSPEAMQMYRKYGQHFEEWSKRMGTKLETIEDVFTIYKDFQNQKQQNQTIPEWAEGVYAPGGAWDEIAKVIRLIRAKPDLVRIRSGFLLKEMLERFKAKQNHELHPDRALYMYSAHSSTVNTLLNGLGFNLPFPEYGSCLLFEMYKTPENKYYLQLFFKNPGDENPEPAKIKKCGAKCSLEDFYEVYRELIPGKLQVECGLQQLKTDEETTASALNDTNAAPTNVNISVFLLVLIQLCTFWSICKCI